MSFHLTRPTNLIRTHEYLRWDLKLQQCCETVSKAQASPVLSFISCFNAYQSTGVFLSAPKRLMVLISDTSHKCWGVQVLWGTGSSALFKKGKSI